MPQPPLLFRPQVRPRHRPHGATREERRDHLLVSLRGRPFQRRPPIRTVLGVAKADIHTLVREAWEDETALGEITSPEAGKQIADHHAEAADIAANGNIETAMQEIAAAVVQSADSEQGIDVETIKSEIIAAMRAELQAIVGSDLKSVIKTAVAEAMADMPAEAPPAGQANSPPRNRPGKRLQKKPQKLWRKPNQRNPLQKRKLPTARLSRIATADPPQHRMLLFSSKPTIS